MSTLFLGAGGFGEEFFGGEFDSFVVAIDNVGGAGDFESGEIVAHGKR